VKRWAIPLCILALGGSVVAADSQKAISPKSLALANRIITDLHPGGVMDQVWNPPSIPGAMPDPKRLAALREAAKENAPAIQALQNGTVEIYARNLSDDEMEKWAEYLESPLGRAVQEKKREAGVFGHPALTAEEKAAQDDFNKSPAATSIMKKNMVLFIQSVQLTTAFDEKFFKSANAIYCRDNAQDCVNGKPIEQHGAQSAPGAQPAAP
jgi:hypothetical protein